MPERPVLWCPKREHSRQDRAEEQTSQKVYFVVLCYFDPIWTPNLHNLPANVDWTSLNGGNQSSLMKHDVGSCLRSQSSAWFPTLEGVVFHMLWLRPKSNEAKRSFSHSQVVSACRCSYDIGPRWTLLDSVQTERWLHSVQIYHARQQVQVMSCEACVEHRKHMKSQSNKFNKCIKALLQLKRSGRNPKGCVVYRCIYVLKVLIWLDGVWQVLALTFPVWQKHLQHPRQIGIRWGEESIEKGTTVNHR